MDENEIIDMLKGGEDFPARENLCTSLRQTIFQSEQGIIGIGDFVHDLELTLIQAKNYLANFKE